MQGRTFRPEDGAEQEEQQAGGDNRHLHGHSRIFGLEGYFLAQLC